MSNPNVSKINLTWNKLRGTSQTVALKSPRKLEMSLKFLYDEHPLFHGIKTKDEARNIWRAEIQSGKPEAYIWFLMDTQDEFKSVIYGSRHSSRNVGELNQFIQSDEPLTGQFLEHDPAYKPQSQHMVERRNPHELSELARATIFDNLNHCKCRTKRDCCNRILSEKIDQMEIPEKVELKKLIPFMYHPKF